MITTSEDNETFIPYFLPQGTILPNSNGVDLTSFAFVPNGMYVAKEAYLGSPETVSFDSPKLAHITLPLVTEGSIQSASDFQARPVTWNIKSLQLPSGAIKVALYVVIDTRAVVSTSIVDLSKTPVGNAADRNMQKLSSLEEAVTILGTGGVEPIQILRKMKDTGF